MQSTELDPDQRPPTPSWSARMRAFLAIYLACAIVFQLGGATPSWGPQSPLEAFNAGLFGMLAVLTIDLAKRRHGAHRAFWFASFAALILLGLDEFFEIHESIDVRYVSETDHLKVALWLGAAGALALVQRLERPARPALVAMAVGYGMHTLYLVAELAGDGASSVPLVSAAFAAGAEDVLQLAMLSAYLLSFSAIASEPAHVERAREEDESVSARAA